MAASDKWKAVGTVIAPMAPTLGKMLGGFIPIPIIGPFIGEKVGEVIAKWLGVQPTPAAVANAIAQMPEAVIIERLKGAVDELKSRYGAIAELQQAENELAKAELQRDVSFMTIVNDAMARDSSSTSVFKSGWRPAMGWVLCYYYFAFATMGIICMGWLLVTRDREPWDAWVAAIPAILAFSIPLGAAVGITAWGKDKVRGQGFEALREAAASAGSALSVPPPKK